jgi:hypothetical protein
VIELQAHEPDRTSEANISEANAMLSEKFLLLLETLKSHTRPDGNPIVVSTSRHVPIQLPSQNGK